MTISYKPLIQATDSAVYVVPPTKKAVVSSVFIKNTSQPCKVSLSVGDYMPEGVDSNFGLELTSDVVPQQNMIEYLPDGSFISMVYTVTYNQYYIMKFKSDGTFDPSFHVIKIGATGGGVVEQIKALPNGRILLYGQALSGLAGFALGENPIYADSGIVAWATPDGADAIKGLALLDSNGYPVSWLGGANAAAIGKTPRIYGVSVASDSSIIISGTFTEVKAYNLDQNSTFVESGYAGVARYNADATLDTTFKPLYTHLTLLDTASITDPRYKTLVQSDGKILVFGDYGTASNTNAKDTVMRLNADGSADSSYGPDGLVSMKTFVGGTVIRKMLLLSDDTILVNGDFTEINGTAVSSDYRLVKLTSAGALVSDLDTSIWTRPVFGSTAGSGVVIGNMIELDNKNLLFRGTFDLVNGQSRIYVAMLNSSGTLLTWDPELTSIPSTALFVSKMADGSILIGSCFFGSYLQDSFFGVARKPSTNSAPEVSPYLVKITNSVAQYLIKDKTLAYGEEITIDGGIALQANQHLSVSTAGNETESVIIQVYGAEL